MAQVDEGGQVPEALRCFLADGDIRLRQECDENRRKQQKPEVGVGHPVGVLADGKFQDAYEQGCRQCRETLPAGRKLDPTLREELSGDAVGNGHDEGIGRTEQHVEKPVRLPGGRSGNQAVPHGPGERGQEAQNADDDEQLDECETFGLFVHLFLSVVFSKHQAKPRAVRSARTLLPTG